MYVQLQHVQYIIRMALQYNSFSFGRKASNGENLCWDLHLVNNCLKMLLIEFWPTRRSPGCQAQEMCPAFKLRATCSNQSVRLVLIC